MILTDCLRADAGNRATEREKKRDEKYTAGGLLSFSNPVAEANIALFNIRKYVVRSHPRRTSQTGILPARFGRGRAAYLETAARARSSLLNRAKGAVKAKDLKKCRGENAVAILNHLTDIGNWNKFNPINV